MGLLMGMPVTGGAIPAAGSLAAVAVGLAGYIIASSSLHLLHSSWHLGSRSIGRANASCCWLRLSRSAFAWP
jgi:hypothetical protein